MAIKWRLIAPCHFGLEAVLKKEIYDLGYEIAEVEDGRVTFYGDPEAVVRTNICLRTAERILIEVGSFHAETFEELYQGTKALPLEDFIPENGRFWVTKAASIKSKLFSPSDIQSIMKKAMVDHLSAVYHIQTFPEDGVNYPFRVFLKKDEVTVSLDTTGDSLHKRGYRKLTAKAPIAENLAASLIMLSPWREERVFVDPFCGSGTFPIEAALMAANIMPGAYRHFTAERWKNVIPEKLWSTCRNEVKEEENRNVKTNIYGYDLDPEMIRTAEANAKMAGVAHLIHFKEQDVRKYHSDETYGFLVTNPPYGERLMAEEDVAEIYRTLGRKLKNLETWSLYMITSYEKAEEMIGRKADKNRKIYNGMLKTYFYQFMGPKPPKNK